MLGILALAAAFTGIVPTQSSHLPIEMVQDICGYAMTGRNQTEFWIHFDAKSELWNLTAGERKEALRDCQIFGRGVSQGLHDVRSQPDDPSN